MSTFYERKNASDAFEREIIETLHHFGWHALPYAFPYAKQETRDECFKFLYEFEDLSKRPPLIRWTPDILTFCRRRDGKSFVALIDAKVSSGEHYKVEMSAVETADIYTDELYTPTFFVFKEESVNDWRVLTPREVRQRGYKGRDIDPKEQTNGSGTAYVVVEKRFKFGRTFREIFEPVLI